MKRKSASFSFFVRKSNENQMIRKSDLKRKKVLLADDSIMQLIMTRSILESWNLEVDAVQNGLEVISNCSKFDYDLLLIDSDMPGPAVQELMKQLRENNKYADTFPIFVVSSPSANDKFQTTASEILTRPLHFTHVYKTLKKHLNIK
jgi:PleD family two-component response regulator